MPVLIGFDGSERSVTAIAVAGRLLAPRDAIVCHSWRGVSRAIFHANPAALPGVLGQAAEDLDDADQAAAAKTASAGAALAREAGFTAESLAVREERKTWRTLLQVAQEREAACIVVGAQGRSGLERVLLGSVSNAVVNHSRVPVLVVPSTGGEGPPLLCWDGSEPAEHAIARAGELLAATAATVLGCWESWTAEAPALAGASKAVMGMASELDEVAGERSAEEVGRGVELARAAGFTAKPLSARTSGPLWRTILDTADAEDASAVVLGSRGLSGMSAALGSVSHGVAHHSPRPVLIIPPEGGAQ